MTPTSDTAPRVTVLMPVYNGEAHLAQAIESVCGQSFADFEFLIINDGSTDRSVEIVQSFGDPRIRLVHNPVNSGLIFTLNRGLELARGDYLARMDCDDVSLPQRLARQVAFLDEHPEIGVCGTWFRKFGSQNKVVRWPGNPDRIRCGFLFNSMVGHPTVMLRRELFRDPSLRYDPGFRDAEDFELWVRVLERCAFANLEEVLLLYRVHESQITQTHSGRQRENSAKVRLSQLRRMGMEPSPEELALHEAVSTCVVSGVSPLFERADQWLCRLKEVNDRVRLYPEPSFSRELADRWLVLCKKALQQGQPPSTILLCPEILKRTGLGRRYVLKYLLRQVAFGLKRG